MLMSRYHPVPVVVVAVVCCVVVVFVVVAVAAAVVVVLRIELRYCFHSNSYRWILAIVIWVIDNRLSSGI